LCTQFYDLDKPEAPPDAMAFYWRLYEQAGGPALEVMCGSGRFLVPFAERRADIDGADASPAMLAACRRKLEAHALQAGLHLQFAEEMDLARRYRFAFLPGGSLVLLEPDAQVSTLQRLGAHLEPGALLAVELHTPAEANYFEGAPAQRRVRRSDGNEIVLTSRDGVYRYDLVQDGTIVSSEVERYGWHPRAREEFVALLQDAGFGDVRAVKPFGETPADESDGLIVYLCRRLVA
jgi:SAM-dependent methyltransferase